jgi:hypothetical protein
VAVPWRRWKHRRFVAQMQAQDRVMIWSDFARCMEEKRGTLIIRARRVSGWIGGGPRKTFAQSARIRFLNGPSVTTGRNGEHFFLFESGVTHDTWNQLMGARYLCSVKSNPRLTC